MMGEDKRNQIVKQGNVCKVFSLTSVKISRLRRVFPPPVRENVVPNLCENTFLARVSSALAFKASSFFLLIFYVDKFRCNFFSSFLMSWFS